jgi:hypothetical protein
MIDDNIIKIECKEQIKLKETKIKNNNIKFPLLKIYKTALNYIRDNDDIYNYCVMNEPQFWMFPKNNFILGDNNIYYRVFYIYIFCYKF